MGIFLARLYPFLNELYQGVIPAADAAVFTRLQYYAVLYSMKTMIDRAVPFQRIMRQYGGAEVSHSLAHIVCGQYLGSGVDHVVVGMTGRSCVDDLKTLFANVEDEQPDESEVGHDR